MNAPIGIFDSGYGGLTVMKSILELLPEYDYIYLGDNARAPYGSRSYDTVHQYTLQAVTYLFSRGCNLVILACNTASAKALRTIQQVHLPIIAPEKRVLGVIRPVTEVLGTYTQTNHVGILGTSGTIQSNSYPIEIAKFHPQLIVTQEACPMWVPLIENGEFNSEGADFFIKKNLDNVFKNDAAIDAIVLACTHYPLLLHKIHKYLPDGKIVVSQGSIVAARLVDYLERHPEISGACSKNGQRAFLTTDSAALFNQYAALFYDETVKSEQVRIG